ncbi:MarR family winged helix-turn-helix transcriptional regulator [Rhizobium sp.]
MDAVDKILAQWNRERPDLDVGPMGLLGRFSRLRGHLTRELETEFARHGLNASSFDVLATLRRSGPPYRLSPGELLETMMITSGTMTNRIDQLEKAGLVERLDNPEDRRGVIIALTDKGFDTVEKTVTAHVANQHRIVAPLDAYERQQLNTLLTKFLAAYE